MHFQNHRQEWHFRDNCIPAFPLMLICTYNLSDTICFFDNSHCIPLPHHNLKIHNAYQIMYAHIGWDYWHNQQAGRPEILNGNCSNYMSAKHCIIQPSTLCISQPCTSSHSQPAWADQKMHSQCLAWGGQVVSLLADGRCSCPLWVGVEERRLLSTWDRRVSWMNDHGWLDDQLMMGEHARRPWGSAYLYEYLMEAR